MQFMLLFKLQICSYIQHDLGFGLLIQKRFYISFYVLFYKFMNFKTFKTRINKDDYFVLFLLFIISLALFVMLMFCYSASALSQCSAVPRCFDCSGSVPLFRCCSVVQRVFHVLVVFCCSGVVPLFRIPVFLVLQFDVTRQGWPMRSGPCEATWQSQRCETVLQSKVPCRTF